MIAIPPFAKSRDRKGVLVQGVIRSNFIFFGLPMAISLYGKESAGIASLLGGLASPLFNVISLFSLEFFMGEERDYSKIVKAILTNQMILASLLGLLFALTNYSLPPMIVTFLKEVASITTPLALIVLGASVTYSSLKKNSFALIMITLLKLIVVPLVVVLVAIAFGYRELELILILALFASPASVTSLTLAQQLDQDYNLAGQIVVTTTSASLLTLFVWISVFLKLSLF